MLVHPDVKYPEGIKFATQVTEVSSLNIILSPEIHNIKISL